MSAADQDALRPLRTFVGALVGGVAAYDNSYAGYDYMAASYPGRYQSIGQYGYAVEGMPIATTAGGGIVISPPLVMLGLGALAVLLWRK